MASQPQSLGQLNDFLAILKRRAWQITIPCGFGLAVGTFFAAVMPRVYTVHTQLEVHEMTPPISGRGFEATSIAREITNASFMIRAPERVRAAVEKQEWEDYAGLSAEEKFDYLSRVLKNINVQTVTTKTQQGSQFISIQYSDSDPQRSARFCNDLRDAYVNDIVKRGRDKALEDQKKLQELRKTKLDIYQDDERKLSELRKKNNLSLTQPAPGPKQARPEDPLFDTLTTTSARLQDVTTQLEAERANNKALHDSYEREPLESPVSAPTGGANVEQLIATIDADITTQKQLIISNGWKPAHSGYQTATARIEALEKRKADLMGSNLQPSVEITYGPNPKRVALAGKLQDSDQKIVALTASKKALESAVKDMKTKQIELTDVYRELSALENDVANTQAEFNDADLAYQHQKDFYEYISGAAGNPFEVIERAEPPKDPSSPIVALVIAGGAIIGLGLGLLTSVLAEFGRNAFRSVGDVARNMSVPVLGSTGLIVTRAEARNIAVRRIAVGLASLLLIGSVLWVTWAWTKHQSMLGTPLRDAINDLREKFR